MEFFTGYLFLTFLVLCVWIWVVALLQFQLQLGPQLLEVGLVLGFGGVKQPLAAHVRKLGPENQIGSFLVNHAGRTHSRAAAKINCDANSRSK